VKSSMHEESNISCDSFIAWIGSCGKTGVIISILICPVYVQMTNRFLFTAEITVLVVLYHDFTTPSDGIVSVDHPFIQLFNTEGINV
jgi:hypothetical protein